MKNENILTMFDRSAAEFGDDTAIEHLDKSLTYAELDSGSNRLANFLISRGAARGSVVAILAESSVQVITAIIGILKAGCAFVPLDSRVPEARLESIISQVSPEWFVAESTLYESLSSIATRTELRARVICTDDSGGIDGVDNGLVCLKDYAEYGDSHKPEMEYGPDDLCYVYFTSGSTGRPKGIAGRLKGIDHFIRWEIEVLGIGRGARVSHLLPPSFDGSLRDIFVPLCAGGTVCVPGGRETILDASSLIEWVDSRKIKLIHCVPSLFRSIVNEDLSPGLFQSLRYILMAGEVLQPADVKKWMDVYGARVQLVNLYGTSETTMAKFFYFVKESDKYRRAIPVGKPMEGAKAMLLDERGRPCAQGMVGEVYIRTAYRALGYYNDPALTREVFIQNPYSEDPDDIVYKTGDLARVLDDGNYEYLGRKDEQVKIRGVRVELKEIESLLRRHENVKGVAVVDRQDNSGSKYLCAYLVLRDETKLGEIREYLAKNLPETMVPSNLVVMAELPLTLSGKVDRRRLPAPGEGRAGLDAEYVAPRNRIEEVMAGIWAEVVGIKQVGVHDNFFQLGGHSLRATQVLSRLRAALKVEVPLRILFERPTVAGVAEVVAAKMSEGERVHLSAIERVSRETELHLSFAQQRLWFLQWLDPDSSAYIMPAAVRLKGQLDVEALEKAINEVISRHEVLRTTFAEVDGNPVQRISPSLPLNIVRVDFSTLPDSRRTNELNRLADCEAQLSFDLSRGPLIRAKLVKLDEQQHVLLVSLHHIICDGWSIGILIKEMGALYEAYSREEQSGLEELQIQYADYAAWQREWLEGEELEKQLSYWVKQLSGSTAVLDLSGGKVRPTVQTYGGASETVVIDKRVTERLKAVGRRAGATLFMTLLAAFKALLYKYSGQTDILVGTDVANRNRVETEQLIGFFINQLVLRTDLSGDPTFVELIGRVREVAEGAYAHQDLPFEKLVERLNPDRGLSHTPLFQVKLILQNTPMPALSVPGLTIEPFNADRQTVKFDLLLELVEIEQGLLAALDYSTELLDAGSAARMVRRFQELLHFIIERPDTRLSDLVGMLVEADNKEQAIKQSEVKHIRRRRLKEVVAKPLTGSLSKEGAEHEQAGNQSL